MIWKPFHVLIGALLVLSGCQKQNETKNTLHLNLNEEPHTLDPRVVRTIKDISLAEQLFEGLMRLDEKGVPKPACANQVDISPDGLEVTFHLRQTTWNDGTPLTASDFLYAWKKVLDKKFASDYAHMLYPIKNAKNIHLNNQGVETLGAVVKDPYTLVVTLEHPTPYFLELTAFPTLFPIKSGIDEENPNWMGSDKTFVSNGPFNMKKWQPHFEIKLSKNETYWDKESVKLATIVFTVIPDPLTESYLFEKGELDWLGQPLSQAIFNEFYQKLKMEKQVSSYPVSGTCWIKFNTTNTLLSDPILRQALALAISRKDLITYLLQGDQKVATSLLPPTIGHHSYFQDGDVAKASILLDTYLEKHKVTKEMLSSLTLSYSSSDRNSKIAQFLQDSWRKTLSLNIHLNGGENKHIRQKVKNGDFTLALGDWIADFKDPISFLEIFKYPLERNGMNDSRWENSAFTKLLDEAMIEKDESKRLALLFAAEKLLVEEMPVAPLYHYAFDYAKKEGVKNVTLSHLGVADFKCAEIERR